MITGHAYSKFIKEDIRCYVCNSEIISDNPKVSELYNTFQNYDIKNIPICGSNAAINFTLNCPEGYKGCLTKTDGNIINWQLNLLFIQISFFFF